MSFVRQIGSDAKRGDTKENIELRVVTMLVKDSPSVSDMDSPYSSPSQEGIAV